MDGTVERRGTATQSVRIPGGAQAAGTARELIGELVGDFVSREPLHDAQLLTTELVTNAVRHADVDEGGTLELSVVVTPATVRVAVTDPGGPTRPRLHDLDVSVPGGMGLYLVDRLSTRWGTERAKNGATEVWFELEHDARPPTGRV